MNAPFKKHSGYDPLGDCGKGKCPVCARNNAVFRIKSILEKDEFFGDAVAPFVGRFGYPNVNVGILAPPEQKEDAWLYDVPRYWAKNNFEIPKIVDFRSSLLNSRLNINIKKSSKYIEMSQDIAMSSQPVDIEIQLYEKPKFRLNLDSYMAPTGPNARLKKASITENPNIHTKVYKVFGDNELKANDAISYLYENKFDETFLHKILSVGTLGLKKDRKLVPTRWSITATDDIIGKKIIETIKDFSEISSCTAFFGGYLGNYYLILLFQEVWSYELFETYTPSNCGFNFNLKCSTDYESYEGRKNYANSTAGGYYAARLPILEKLKGIGKQASVIALRFITDEYSMPLGVFVVREAARKAMSSPPIEFGSKELMIKYAEALVKRKFNWDVTKLLKNSILLKNIRSQTKLSMF